MENKKPFVLGIDAGTGSVRAGIFDVKGRPVVFSSKEYSTVYPSPGWAEQNPDEWWKSLVEANITKLNVSCLASFTIALAISWSFFL